MLINFVLKRSLQTTCFYETSIKATFSLKISSLKANYQNITRFKNKELSLIKINKTLSTKRRLFYFEIPSSQNSNTFRWRIINKGKRIKFQRMWETYRTKTFFSFFRQKFFLESWRFSFKMVPTLTLTFLTFVFAAFGRGLSAEQSKQAIQDDLPKCRFIKNRLTTIDAKWFKLQGEGAGSPF